LNNAGRRFANNSYKYVLPSHARLTDSRIQPGALFDTAVTHQLTIIR